MGWPGCHVIAKLIFVAFNKHAEIPKTQTSPAHVIRPIVPWPCNGDLHIVQSFRSYPTIEAKLEVGPGFPRMTIAEILKCLNHCK